MRKLAILSIFIFVVLSTLVRAEITTDKEFYKPGETMHIDLVHTTSISNVELKIIGPDGKEDKKPMVNVSSNHWTYNYTLGTKALNGSHIINITALQAETLINASTPVLTFYKTFEVVAWGLDISLNKDVFVIGDTVNFTLYLKGKYSDDLRFEVSYIMKDPLDIEIKKLYILLTETNKGFRDAYVIPDNYTLGESKINIWMIDTDKRIKTVNLTFTVSQAISITPDTINETITQKTIERTLQFENFRDSDVNINTIEVSQELENIVSIKERPYLIPARGSASMKIEIDTTNLAKGSYEGVIDIYSDVAKGSVNIKLDVISLEGEEIENYSYIIWYFAIGIVVVIIIITIIALRKKKTKKKDETKKEEKKKDEKKEEEIYYKPYDEYRTEYY